MMAVSAHATLRQPPRSSLRALIATMCGAPAGMLATLTAPPGRRRRGGAVPETVTKALAAAIVVVIAVLLAGLPGRADGLRVVAVVGAPDASHRAWVSPLLSELAKRGHQVDVVELRMPRHPSGDAAEDALASSVRAQQEKLWTSERNASAFQALRDAYALGRLLSEWQVPQLAEVPADALRGPADVLLADYQLNDAALLVSWRRLHEGPTLGPAVVLVNAEVSAPRWAKRAAGSPPPPIAAPHCGLARRLQALALTVYDHYLYHWKHLPAEQVLAGTVSDSHPGVAEPLGRLPVAMVLTNDLPGLDQDAALVPRERKVAGITSEQLVLDIPFFKERSVDMVLDVLVDAPYLDRPHSLSDVLPDGLADALRALLREDVVQSAWVSVSSRSGLDPRPGYSCIVDSSTVKWIDWVDGAAVLANHGEGVKVAVWVGSPGLAHVAALRGVPQVGVPLVRGESDLVDKLARAGVATRLDPADINAPERLVQAVRDVRADGGMYAAASALRTLLPASPLRLAVEAVELAPHLARVASAPSSKSLPLHQLLNVDALLALLVLATLIVAAIATFCAMLLTLLCYRKKVRVRPAKLKQT